MRTSNQAKRQNTIYVFWVYFILATIAGVLIPNGSSLSTAFNVFHVLMCIALLICWVHYGSQIAGLGLSKVFKAGIVFLALILVPLYLYRSRGLAKGALVLCVFLLKLVVLLIVLLLAFAAIDIPEDGVINMAEAASKYAGLFETMLWIGLASGALMLIATPLLRGWMHGKK